MVWVAFVFFFLKKENYIFNGSHLSLFHKKHRDLTFPWCQCRSQKLLIPVCVLHSIVGSLDSIEGPWFFFVVVFGCAMWSAGLQFPDQGLNLSPQQWEREVLTTGPPGKSQRVLGADCVSKATMRNYYLPLEKNKRKFFFMLHCPYDGLVFGDPGLMIFPLCWLLPGITSFFFFFCQDSSCWPFPRSLVQPSWPCFYFWTLDTYNSFKKDVMEKHLWEFMGSWETTFSQLRLFINWWRFCPERTPQPGNIKHHAEHRLLIFLPCFVISPAITPHILCTSNR